MGPDCGTAYLNGVGLGFANVVPRGRIGCVAASGTGLQAVASHVAALGEGISHGIGVGGRDLSAAVGGVDDDARARGCSRADPATEVIVLISKPPAPRVHAAARRNRSAPSASPSWSAASGRRAGRGAPAVGRHARGRRATPRRRVARGEPWTSARVHATPAAVRARLARVGADAGRRGRACSALYTGGTLAHEARLLLEPLLGPLGTAAGGSVTRSSTSAPTSSRSAGRIP